MCLQVFCMFQPVRFDSWSSGKALWVMLLVWLGCIISLRLGIYSHATRTHRGAPIETTERQNHCIQSWSSRASYDLFVVACLLSVKMLFFAQGHFKSFWFTAETAFQFDICFLKSWRKIHPKKKLTTSGSSWCCFEKHLSPSFTRWQTRWVECDPLIAAGQKKSVLETCKDGYFFSAEGRIHKILCCKSPDPLEVQCLQELQAKGLGAMVSKACYWSCRCHGEFWKPLFDSNQWVANLLDVSSECSKQYWVWYCWWLRNPANHLGCINRNLVNNGTTMDNPHNPTY